ncbi:hypothetical protein [Paenibacillus sp. JDR-2]|uniref:hypothetical protein n=1 Tax=Paenibacillus sp. (strain JDR-2) TaxID=324057 RepID=UPI0001664735|nr:hypothetical protein [Paenibacillus sp. JDR-2]ACT03775.1 hypothetical protein Pjdr2_5164 [Paenibacillus sp. JDR-2]
MKTTSNLGLMKPEGTDVVDIENFNTNSDTLDTTIGAMSTVPTTAKNIAGAIKEIHTAMSNLDTTISDGEIATAKLADSAVTTIKLAANAVTGTKMANSTVTATQLADGAVTSAKLADSGVSAGTYKSVTVDGKGRVTAGSNPTTLSGYGITDAAPLASPALTGTPTVPNALAGTSTTQAASTKFVMDAVRPFNSAGYYTIGDAAPAWGNYTANNLFSYYYPSSTAEYNGELYVPDTSNSGTVPLYKYNMNTKKWTQLATLSIPSIFGFNFKVLVIGGVMHLIGVGGSATYYYKYTISSNTWSSLIGSTSTITQTGLTGIETVAMVTDGTNLYFGFKPNATTIYVWRVNIATGVFTSQAYSSSSSYSINGLAVIGNELVVDHSAGSVYRISLSNFGGNYTTENKNAGIGGTWQATSGTYYMWKTLEPGALNYSKKALVKLKVSGNVLIPEVVYLYPVSSGLFMESNKSVIGTVSGANNMYMVEYPNPAP